MTHHRLGHREESKKWFDAMTQRVSVFAGAASFVDPDNLPDSPVPDRMECSLQSEFVRPGDQGSEVVVNEVEHAAAAGRVGIVLIDSSGVGTERPVDQNAATDSGQAELPGKAGIASLAERHRPGSEVAERVEQDTPV